MKLDLQHIYELIGSKKVVTDRQELSEKYCSACLDKYSEIPLVACHPKNTNEIKGLINYFKTIQDLNVLIISSRTNPKFLNDTVVTKNTAIIDLSEMKEIPFINKRNKVCVIEPGVKWEELVIKLKEHDLRPLTPFLPRPGKSALASILDREPHLIAKKQFDISDPLLCMEVVFGNGETFRTGEAAGPLSIEENRKAGAALTNPLGPGQTDIFRIIQGSKGTFGCVSWISMQCDLIPSKRVIKFIMADQIEPLTEFVYTSVRQRLIDEIFIIDDNYFMSIFPTLNGIVKKYILIYAINGYEILPDEKIEYQTLDVEDILNKLELKSTEGIATITQKDIEPILDGYVLDPHPKITEKTVSVDLFYNTTLGRVSKHILEVKKIIKRSSFPENRLNIYIQPIIQARAVNVEFSLVADKPDSDSKSFPISKVEEICKEIGLIVSKNGGYFSRSYKLIKDLAFNDKNEAVQESLRKLKRIFDPENILNKGELIF